MTHKALAYQAALQELEAVLAEETHAIAKMATCCSVLRQHLPYFFWVGFYLVHDGALIVGPYQGTMGCLHIDFKRGVCGRAARTLQTQIVTDTHADPEHIACDARSLSEIVVPVFNDDYQLIAVLDVDSLEIGSFDAEDQHYLEQLIRRHFGESPLDFGYRYGAPTNGLTNID